MEMQRKAGMGMGDELVRNHPSPNLAHTGPQQLARVSLSGSLSKPPSFLFYHYTVSLSLGTELTTHSAMSRELVLSLCLFVHSLRIGPGPLPHHS